MLENFPLEPIDETVARTYLFFTEAAKRSKSEVERAEARVDDAFRNYDDENWEAGNVIRLAEEHLAKCEAEHNNNVQRAAWEAIRAYAREIKPSRPMVTPWIHNPKAWLAIFAHYKLMRPVL